MMIVEDHAAFAQALEFVLGRVRISPLPARSRKGGPWSGPQSLSMWWCSTFRSPTGTDLIPEIRQRYPQTRVVILSARDDVGEVASEAGADASLPKETPLPEIISFLKLLAE